MVLQRSQLKLEDVIQKTGKPVIEAGERFEHIMALSLDPRQNSNLGVIRCIESRKGNVGVKGFVDKSSIQIVERKSDQNVVTVKELEISKEKKIVSKIRPEGYEFLGLEDPDIWFDEETGKLHLYFTIAFRHSELGIETFLGHAEGPELDSLEMTMPVAGHSGIAKEVAIVPENQESKRVNLIESSQQLNDTSYSVVRKVIADEMGGKWKTGEVALHPANLEYDWCSGHLSPGPLLPREFIDVGKYRRVGILNGRKPDQEEGDITRFGEFSVGLMIYNYRSGEVEWVSENSLINDAEAGNVTFASEFVQKNQDKGIIYAHIDDSYVQAYELDSEKLSRVLPDKQI